MSDITTRYVTLKEHRARQVNGVRRYAAADRSDPFSFARGMAHLNAGLCASKTDGSPGGYDAEEYQEPRFYEMDGERVDYTVSAFRNVKRP